MPEKAKNGVEEDQMNKKLKRELKQIYEAPRPKRKKEFLGRFEQSEISTWAFLRIQFHYIRKLNWITAVLIFGLSICGSIIADRSMVWILSACIPFLALTTTTEFGQSARWGMQELELSSRFSLKFVMMARMGILGIGNFILLIVIFSFAWKRQQTTWLDLGLSILLPYLLTTFLNLEVTRKIHGKESLYVCMADALFVSGGFVIDGNIPNSVFDFFSRQVWMGILVLLVVLVGREAVMLLRQTEEYVWN